MTDAHLMDAECIHGFAWWACDPCWQDLEANQPDTEPTEVNK
jgi:hypothetical protein